MPSKWNFNLQFPTDSNFINRIVDVTFGPSKSSGNPMLTIEAEVISPETVDIGGDEVSIVGVKTVDYYTTKNLDDAVKSAKALDRVKKLLNMLFPDNPEYATDFDPENPSQEVLNKMKGLCILTQMSPDIEEKRKNPTPAQMEVAKKAGKYPEGDVMKNPVTGKPLTSYRPKIREVFGLAPAGAGANRPY